MKKCPVCSFAPYWHNARNVSMREKCQHYIFAGCRHAEAFASARRFVPEKECAAVEAAWDAEAEKLFAEYTSGPRWTDVARAAYKARLWPMPLPVVPRELFDRNRDEAPTVGSALAGVRLPYADNADEKHPFEP